jgi:chromosome segregation ATPase
MTPESLPTDLNEIDPQSLKDAPIETLQKIVDGLSNKRSSIEIERREKGSAIAKLESEINFSKQQEFTIAGNLRSFQALLEKKQLETDLVESVRNLRPVADRVNELSRQLYEALDTYLQQVKSIESEQKSLDFNRRGVFETKAHLGNLPIVLHKEGNQKFELLTLDNASNRSRDAGYPFNLESYGFSHQYSAGTIATS